MSNRDISDFVGMSLHFSHIFSYLLSFNFNISELYQIRRFIFGVFQIYCMLRITILTEFRIFGLFWNISL